MPVPPSHLKSAPLSWNKYNGPPRSPSPASSDMSQPNRFKPGTVPPSRLSGTVHYLPSRPRPHAPTPPPPPYARVQQRQVTYRDRSNPTVPTKALEKNVFDNNAFLFAQSLMTYLKSPAEYLRLDEHRQIETLIETIVSALSTHLDPPEFIINALITVGTVAGLKNFDPEFELLVSALLAESLRRYLTWQRDVVEEHGNNSSESSPLDYQGDGDDDEDDKDYGSESDDTSVSAAVEENQLDLIVLDDDEESIGHASLRARSPHANIEPFASTLSATLDESTAIPEIDGTKVLKPSILDLIDFSTWDRLETPSMTGSIDNSVDSKGWQILEATTKSTPTPVCSPMGDDNNAVESVGGLLDINLTQPGGMNFLLKEDVHEEKKPARTEIAELIHIFDSHLQTDYQDTSDGDEEGDCSALDRGEADDEKEDSGDSGQEDDDAEEDDDIDGPIQPHHRQKLKEEISSGKSSLQVFVALDVMDMHKTLRQQAPPKEDNRGSIDTYGALLAHQLLQKGRYRECIVVLSKNIGPSIGVEQALLSRLLELGEEGIISAYIENDLERCRKVLLHINHQLSFQFYYWGLATTDMSQSDPPEYAEVPPIRGAGRARVQTRLVETAMGLIMFFDLEEDQPSYKFLDMFVRFCTVSTLLSQSSPSTSSLYSNDPTQRPNNIAAQLGGGVSGGKGKEYLLTTAWRHVPLVLEMTRGSVTLQRITIQHCIERRDLITAKFLASKLDIMEYYLEIAESDGRASSIPAAVKATHPGAPLSEAALAAATAPGSVSLYRLPSETKVFFVRQAHQLESMSAVLERSRVVGMDTEWLPNIPEFRDLQKKEPRTAIIQLASDVDEMVFVVDVIAFLEGVDGGRRLVQVLGSIFRNPKILKLAFDWDGDQDMLEGTFSELHQQHNRLQNFVDLKFLWFNIRDSNNNNSADQSNSRSHNSATARGHGRNAPVSMTGMLEAWSSLAPSLPGMYSIPGGLSGLLARLCGHKLDKSEQCSQWEQRPLTTSQLTYAASDAKCLLEIYAALMTIEQV
ncbi:Exonuclease mut-7 [Mortierella hygrophila]|uniref:Exonuclease mut-7 n=1 Tax=Mortierella hygrophila TaxID=979708 RepID=A0A9P6K8D1_9FUNG|nr:Exonuclease mut-7 [Mortierella hygrophila]